MRRDRIIADRPDRLSLARDLVKSAALERREVKRQLDSFRGALDNMALVLVDTLELLEGFLEAMGDGGCGDLGEALGISLRAGWERLETMGFEMDHEADITFDAGRHRIVKEESAPGNGERFVAQVVHRGIRFRGRQIRPAHVVVHVKGE